MMKHILTLALAALLLLPGCISIPGGAGPDGSYEDLTAGPAAPKRDITFSVDFSADLGPANWYGEEEIIFAIREQLAESGLFGKISYVNSHNASDYHYVFKVVHSGTDVNTRAALALCSGFSLTTIPIWHNYELNWTMSVQSHGKEVYSVSSQQTTTDIIWLPCIAGTLFMNHGTIGGGMKTRPLRYFVRQIREQHLNELP